MVLVVSCDRHMFRAVFACWIFFWKEKGCGKARVMSHKQEKQEDVVGQSVLLRPASDFVTSWFYDNVSLRSKIGGQAPTMEKPISSSFCWVLALSGVFFLVVSLSDVEAVDDASPQFSAMFVFGDSLVDHGNNNYLASLAKANYLPYGIDFGEGPTGRFCNGKTIIDFLGDLVGLPHIPAFINTLTDERSIRQGVNYASAAGGIRDDSGRQLGDRFPLYQQVQQFQRTLNHLKNRMGDAEMRQHLAKSLVVMNLGNNDYLNNYLMPTLYDTSFMYKPPLYAEILIDNYTTRILELHNLGLRKFVIAAVGPLGCMPNQLAAGEAPPGTCVAVVNEIVSHFNVRLRSLINRLNNMRLSGDTIFVYGNTYDLFYDIFHYANKYGLNVVDRGCCGNGRYQGEITCLPLQIPCPNRDEYMFWDAFHPTEVVNKIIAERAYGGSPADFYPINVKKMAQL